MLFGENSSKKKLIAVERANLPHVQALIKTLNSIINIMSCGLFGMQGCGIIECCGYLIKLLQNGAIDIGQAMDILAGIKSMLQSIIVFAPRMMTEEKAAQYKQAVNQLMIDIGAYASLYASDNMEYYSQINSAINLARSKMLQENWGAMPVVIPEVRARARAAEMATACNRRPADPHAAIAPDLAEVPQVDHLAEGQTPDQAHDRAGGKAGAGGNRKPPKYGW